MKRTIILLFAIYSLLTLAAQDLIITKDSDKIEAKIVEISKEQIKYLDYNNLDGPIYILSAEDLSSIIFSNGQVKVYNQTAQYAKSMVITETEQNISSQPISGYVTRSGNTYYHNGISMRGSNYASFLQQNCTPAYNQYHDASILAAVGWGLLAGGLIVDLGFSWWAPYTAFVGGACEIACIPTLIVGYVRMHRSADTFNMQCVSQTKLQAYWSLNADQNGIGLALHF